MCNSQPTQNMREERRPLHQQSSNAIVESSKDLNGLKNAPGELYTQLARVPSIFCAG